MKSSLLKNQMQLVEKQI